MKEFYDMLTSPCSLVAVVEHGAQKFGKTPVVGNDLMQLKFYFCLNQTSHSSYNRCGSVDTWGCKTVE